MLVLVKFLEEAACRST